MKTFQYLHRILLSCVFLGERFYPIQQQLSLNILDTGTNVQAHQRPQAGLAAVALVHHLYSTHCKFTPKRLLLSF